MSRWLLTFVTTCLIAHGCADGASDSDDSESAGYTLRVEVRGWGDVTPPSGTYDRDSIQTLMATPHGGWIFTGWSGDAHGNGTPVTVDMDADKSIVATFTQYSAHPNWNGTAVRKVLQTFAWGGFPTEEQIAMWGAMEPEVAIREMLTFEPLNDKLSPPDFDSLGTAIAAHIPEGGGQLEGIARYFREDPDELIDPERSLDFDLSQFVSIKASWELAATARGLNTFYHRMGLWETNYHMVTTPTLVVPHPMIRHYDNIMGDLSAGSPYGEVVGHAALNAAVAYQYGHNYNHWHQGEFIGNEDFAREFHQLFFGILGDVNVGGQAYHDNHEFVSIKNTAKVLTGLNAYYDPSAEIYADLEIDFEEEIDKHHVADLTILDETITGATAKEKIAQLSTVAIAHPESLNNLPIMIVAGLADDKLTPEKVAAIRTMWAELPEKNLLTFLQTYAVSSLFHASGRLRYHTSIDRLLFIYNRMQLSNQELYEGKWGLHVLRIWFRTDLTEPFDPVHDVFGHQGTVEAYNNPEIFKNAYNRSTEDVHYFDPVQYVDVQSESGSLVKDWQAVIPQTSSGQWLVKDVARFLWQRFVADGLKNFGTLEQAHIYALLGSRTEEYGIQGVDLGFFLDETDPERIYTMAELEAEPLLSRIVALGEQPLALDDEVWTVRKSANNRIQRAIAFIAATPYVFLQEGK